MESLISSPANLYEQVANRVATLIEQGTFRPGERIPSVRGLSRQQAVSVTTILQAYRVLEDQGLIEARPQSGYYVRPPRLDHLAEPLMSRPRGGAARIKVDDLITGILRTLADPDMVQLGAASPAPDLLPSARLHRSLSAAGRRLGARAGHYCPSPGLEVLRVQIARRLVDAGCSLSPDDILVTCGAQEAISLSLRTLCRTGDAVAIESPTYFGVLQAIELEGLRAVEIPTCPRNGMDVEALRGALDSHPIRACVVASNVANPIGSTMPDESKRALAELLQEREVPLIEDDTFGDLAFGPHAPRVAKAWDQTGLVLLCSSFSKTLAPGYRVGWVAGGRFQHDLERLKFVTNVATPTLPQFAIADFLRNGGYDRHLRRVRRVYQRQIALMTDAIGRAFPAGTRVTRPSGGFVLWVEMPSPIDAMVLHEQALEKRITVVPGPLFSAKKSFKNCLRLNAAFWSPEVERAIHTLGRLAEAQL